MQKTPSIRAIAIHSLGQWEKGHVYAESLVQTATQKYLLRSDDRNLLNTIVVNSIRHLSLLDFWISELREGELDPDTRNTLRVGLCQLFIVKIPSHAAVNETVNATKKHTRGLVNALLRKSLREFDKISAKTEEQPLHIRLSHPEWLTNRWTEYFGKEDTEKLLQWNQQPTKTIFRLNILKNNVHQILDEAEGIQSLPDHPDFFQSNGLPPKAWIKDGLIYIQDPATSRAVDMLAPQPGEMILDACAAPGGKSTQIAAHMQNSGKLVCTDSNPKRIPRLQENLERLGVTIAEVETCDWLEPAPAKYQQQFDGILLDVPCSNTGVLGKRIDARWRVTPESITDLTKLQMEILENALHCLKLGGRMVYSTCSIDKEENTQLIHSFLKKFPHLTLESEHQILPHKDQTDGAYAACIRT